MHNIFEYAVYYAIIRIIIETFAYDGVRISEDTEKRGERMNYDNFISENETDRTITRTVWLMIPRKAYTARFWSYENVHFDELDESA